MSSADSPITDAVVEFILGTGAAQIPEDVKVISRRCFVDGAGLMVAGSTDNSGRIVQAYAKEIGGEPEARIVGTEMTVPAHTAAFANGVAAHAMDYDDTQLSSYPDRIYGLMTHPTSPVLAASLAMAELLGSTGEELLTAFMIGFEVECKVAECIKPEHYIKGFHSTGTIGAIGAAAASAKLLGLGEAQLRFCLGIVCSESAGLRANFGTMTKPFHSGRAAENGVVAARLAAGGFTSDPGIFDGEWGFMQIMGGGCDPEYLIGKLGDPWSAVDPGISIKPYPSGSLSHPSMDAMRDLILEHGIKPGEVKRVRLGTNTRVLQPLRYDDPQNELEAKFSMKYSLAILLLNGGKGGIAQYRDEVVESPEVKAMLEKVEPFVDEEIEAMGYDLIRSKLTIEMEDGTVHEKFSDTSRGTPKRPMDREELYEKFTECCSLVYGKDQIARAEASLYKVDTLDGVYTLIDVLGPKVDG